MRLLITRSTQETPRELKTLSARGHEAIACPLLQIKQLPAARLVLEGAQAVLVTSCAGVRALAEAEATRDIPVFAVGDATAEVARNLGYGHVESARGDWLALAALVRRRLDPGGGRVVHAAGAAVAGDMEVALAAEGFDVERAVLYEAKLAPALSDEGTENLRSGKLDAVLFFSPRAAATFVRLVSEAGLNRACTFLDALCLSANVALAISPLAWRRVRTAATPDREALYRLLDTDD